jgi:prepilin-type N-terminal cleavage/methylation domain-containing protein
MLKRTRKAFTLLELIVVVIVLGILALIAVPTFRSVTNNASASVAESTAGAIARNANALASQAGVATTYANLTTAAGEVTASSGMTITTGVGTGSQKVRVAISRSGSTGNACIQITSGVAVASSGDCV